MKLKSLVALKITVPGIACVQSVLMAASKVGKGILRIVVDGQQKLETPAIKDLYLWIIPIFPLSIGKVCRRSFLLCHCSATYRQDSLLACQLQNSYT